MAMQDKWIGSWLGAVATDATWPSIVECYVRAPDGIIASLPSSPREASR